MTVSELTVTALAIESILYVLLAAATLKRGNLRERVVRTLLLCAVVSALWLLEQLAWRVGWLDPLEINAYLLVRIPLYGLLILSLLFLYLTRFFVRLPGSGWPWAILGIAWLAGLILLESNTLALPDLLWTGGGWSLDRMSLCFGLAVAGWVLVMATTLIQTLKAYRRAHLPLHRNRLIYWLLVWGAILAGDLLFLAGYEVIGSDIRLLGMLIAAYAILTHDLPDIRQTIRRAASYLLLTFLTVAIYTAGFTAVQTLFQNVPAYSPLWAGAAVALLLAVLFDPLLHLVQRLINRQFTGVSYDPSRMVSEYSLRISNIVSLERLATTAVGLINEALKIRRGALFLVDHTKDERGASLFHLQGISGIEKDPYALPRGTLSGNSPVTHHLRETRRPLSQYDIDLLPDFQHVPADERAWLSSLGMDVYVPIHAQGSWIGLLAVGPKISGDRYFAQDLALLSTLADQTAVALENARLVDDLIWLNQDLNKALAELARVNRQLQEMDKLKSAFISVITHELRSPFVNIAFSLQLFERYGLDNLTPEQREQLENLTTSLRQAKAMVDNLVTFATFLSKQGELRLTEVDLHEALQQALAPLQPMAETKGLQIHTLVPERLPLVQADRERLSDAMGHLVHNAIKFTPSGGEVWVRCQAKGDALHFEVQDTGAGVPADKLPGLWEGFSQMADPLRRGVEGLGLGLALVKYIVAAHGGQVRAESQEGVGSTFGFQVPLSGPQAAGPAPGWSRTTR